MALYHKYRPQKFSDLLGQKHISQTLQNAFREGLLAHAYLFSGPRGLGKTTTARLLAKTVNCLTLAAKKTQSNEDIEPCNRCENCLAVQNGSTMDVIEIDAASNRGIDEIRELRELIKLPPSRLRKKIIIIDEVHMLTNEAFNAVLKTLEEPPSHIMFIMATTEPHRVPATVLSRVQRFNFKPALPELLSSYLQKIARKEGKRLDGEGAKLISRLADGSFRDAVSIFDQVAGGFKKISALEIQNLLGLTDRQQLDDFFAALEKNDRTRALRIIDNFLASGGDCVNFAAQALSYARNLLRSDKSDQALKWTTGLLAASENIKYSPSPKIPLEIFIAQNTASNSLKKVDNIQAKNGDSSQTSEPPAGAKKIKIKKEPAKTAKNPKTNFQQNSQSAPDSSIWNDIAEKLKEENASLASLLKNSQPLNSADGTLAIAVKYKFHKKKILDPKNLSKIQQLLAKLTGVETPIKCVVDPEYVKKREKTDDQDLVSDALEIFS